MLMSPSFQLDREIETTDGTKIKNMSDLTFVIPEKFSYSIVEVPQDWEARPDLVSISHYGDDMFTELICRLNGISNPFELNAGTRLICPDPSEVYNFFVKDTTNYQDNETKATSETSSDTETRKPSDVTVGDSRYKVDNTRKIVVY